MMKVSGSDWERARSPEQIEERHMVILEAAAAVFHEHTFEDVTLQMIARKAGYTRTNLYRYYKTREEIFLVLFVEDMEQFTQETEKNFSTPLSVDEFISAWSVLVYKQKRLLELTPHLALSLEKNSSDAVYRKTKVRIAEFSARMAEVIMKAQPQLSPEQIHGFLQMHLVITAGGYPFSCITEKQRSILKELGLESMRMDFGEFYQSMLRVYLKGAAATSAAIGMPAE